jgi:asparagine synthase (glutamine-hydrolysing)
VKVDRASMGVGLEIRSPMLDHRVAELAWSLPPAMRLDRGGGKRVLKAVLARHLPPALTDRPKAGFGVPILDWLRGPLRGWAADLLAPDRVAREGFLEPAAVDRVWRQHLSGWDRNPQLLWSILMFQLWLERWGTAPRRPHGAGTPARPVMRREAVDTVALP